MIFGEKFGDKKESQEHMVKDIDDGITNLNLNDDENAIKINLDIKPIKISLKKHNLKFPVDGMF